MNGLANLYVNMHLQELLDEAARNRAHRIAKPSLRSRVDSALTSLRRPFSGPRPLPA